MDLVCPVCVEVLVPLGRNAARCPADHGSALAWDALSRAFWGRDGGDLARVVAEGAPTHRICPGCRSPMSRSTIRTPPTYRVDALRVARGVPLELDLCARCRLA